MINSMTLLLEAVVKGDPRLATDAYLEMNMSSENVNREALKTNDAGVDRLGPL